MKWVNPTQHCSRGVINLIKARGIVKNTLKEIGIKMMRVNSTMYKIKLYNRTYRG
jgi:hypothetical protein